MSEYHIEKRRRPVSVLLHDGRRLTGDVFVPSTGRAHPLPAEPIDLLNEDEPFFPLARPDGAVVLVAKDHVLTVEQPAGPADNPLEVPALGEPAAFLLADGSEVEGYVFPAIRSERPRLLDYLNQHTSRFLAVFTADHVRLVNCRWVITVEQRV